MKTRSGFTLIELIVVIVLLGSVVGIVGLAIPGPVPQTDSAAARLFAGRQEALRSGKPVIIWLADSGSAQSAVALPDGSIVGDSLLQVDRFAGRLRADSMARP